MDIGDVLQRAARFTWRFKGLWILGILGSCQGGQAQLSNNIAGNMQGFALSDRDLERFESFLEGLDWESFVPKEPNWDMVPIIGIGLLALLLLLWLFFFALEILGTSGLIAAFKHADDGQEPSLGVAFSLGLNYFWRLLGMQLIVGAITLSFTAVMGIAMLAIIILTLGIGVICLLPLLVVLVPLFIAAGVYVNLSRVAVVIENIGIMAAFVRSLQVIRANIGAIILMALLLFVAPWLMGIILSVPFAAAGLPALLGLTISESDFILKGLAGTLLCAIAYFPIYLLFVGIINTFTTGAWTLVYRRLIGQRGSNLLPGNPADALG